MDKRKIWTRVALVVLGLMLAYGLFAAGNIFFAAVVVVIAAGVLISLLIQRKTPPELGE